MPMRNAGAFLADAMKSILSQSEADFTFLIIDDGSQDASLEIAAKLADYRTEIVADGRHLGLVARLNWGLDNVRTRFVARMDADDVSAPQRLSRQLAFMQSNPQIGICGSWYVHVRPDGTSIRIQLPLRHDALCAMLIFGCPFAHPAVMFNMEHLDAASLRYAEAATHAEDYDLWERACDKTVFANIPEFLLRYRAHSDQVSRIQGRRQREVADGVRRRALLRLGVDPTPAELSLHGDYATDHDMDQTDRLKAARTWLLRLERQARLRGEEAIEDECARRGRRLSKVIRRRTMALVPETIGRFRQKLWRAG